jgi:hypothetical protein
MVFLVKTDGYPRKQNKKQKSDTNKNVTKMGVVIKGIYCTTEREDRGQKQAQR